MAALSPFKKQMQKSQTNTYWCSFAYPPTWPLGCGQWHGQTRIRRHEQTTTIILLPSSLDCSLEISAVVLPQHLQRRYGVQMADPSRPLVFGCLVGLAMLIWKPAVWSCGVGYLYRHEIKSSHNSTIWIWSANHSGYQKMNQSHQCIWYRQAKSIAVLSKSVWMEILHLNNEIICIKPFIIGPCIKPGSQEYCILAQSISAHLKSPRDL